MDYHPIQKDWLQPQGLVTGSDFPWFAIRVKSNFERSVALSLRSRGFEEFLPTYRVQRPRAGQSKEVELPLFPGYLFSRFDVNRRLPIVTVPGLLYIVGPRTPVPVDPGELAAIRTIVTSQLPARPWPFLQVGERVYLNRGPLRGLEGILICTKSETRIVVSVTLLQRSVVVDLDLAWAQPIKPEQNAAFIAPGREQVCIR